MESKPRIDWDPNEMVAEFAAMLGWLFHFVRVSRDENKKVFDSIVLSLIISFLLIQLFKRKPDQEEDTKET